MRRTYLLTTLSRALLAGCVMSPALAAGPALPLPSGLQVAQGQATLNTQGSLLTVRNTPNAILNWQSFSIAAGHGVYFDQASSSSKVLNRVLGSEPSQILGSLASNGQVWLLNPNGVLFGQGARVDVASLVVSTLRLNDNDFLAGRYSFNSLPGDMNAGLRNEGALRSSFGGQIALIGAGAVENAGSIEAPGGRIDVIGAQSVDLVDTGLPNLVARVAKPAGQALNLGRLSAAGGLVDVYAATVNQDGYVQADSLERDARGQVVLRAAGGTLTLGGGSVTTADGGSGRGGRIELLGEQVALLDGARVDASGDAGGGRVFAGGGAAGRDASLPNAQALWMGAGARIAADARVQGDGGAIVLWSDQATRAYGSFSARGGAQGGTGGSLETSGGWLDARPARLNVGHWLLDPDNITISDTGPDQNIGSGPDFTSSGSNSLITTGTIAAALNGGNSVTVTTASGSGSGQGDITMSGATLTVAPSAAVSLTLNAQRDITLNSATIRSTDAPLNLTLNAAGNGSEGKIAIYGSTIASAGGSLVLQGGGTPFQYRRPDGSYSGNAYAFVTAPGANEQAIYIGDSQIALGSGSLSAAGQGDLSGVAIYNTRVDAGTITLVGSALTGSTGLSIALGSVLTATQALSLEGAASGVGVSLNAGGRLVLDAAGQPAALMRIAGYGTTGGVGIVDDSASGSGFLATPVEVRGGQLQLLGSAQNGGTGVSISSAAGAMPAVATLALGSASGVEISGASGSGSGILISDARVDAPASASADLAATSGGLALSRSVWSGGTGLHAQGSAVSLSESRIEAVGSVALALSLVGDAMYLSNSTLSTKGGDIRLGGTGQGCLPVLGCQPGGGWIGGAVDISASTLDAGAGAIVANVASASGRALVVQGGSVLNARDIRLTGIADAATGLLVQDSQLDASHQLSLSGTSGGGGSAAGLHVDDGARLSVRGSEPDAAMTLNGDNRGTQDGIGLALSGDTTHPTTLLVDGARLNLEARGPQDGVYSWTNGSSGIGVRIDAAAALAGVSIDGTSTRDSGTALHLLGLELIGQSGPAGALSLSGSGGQMSLIADSTISAGVPISISSDSTLQLGRSSVTTRGGISLAGSGSAANISGNGVELYSSQLASSGAGDLIALSGQGSVSGGGGVAIYGSTLSADSVRITGTALASGAGIDISDSGPDAARITAVNLSLSGQGAGNVGVSLYGAQLLLTGRGTAALNGNGVSITGSTLSGDAASLSIVSGQSLQIDSTQIDFSGGAGTAILLAADGGAALDGSSSINVSTIRTGGGDLLLGSEHTVCSSRLGCSSSGNWFDGSLSIGNSTLDAGGGVIRGGAASSRVDPSGNADALGIGASTLSARDIVLAGRADEGYGVVVGYSRLGATHLLSLDGLGAGEIDAGAGGVLVFSGTTLAVNGSGSSDAALTIVGTSASSRVGQGVQISGATVLRVEQAALKIQGTGPSIGVQIEDYSGEDVGGSNDALRIEAGAARPGAAITIEGRSSRDDGVAFGLGHATVVGPAAGGGSLSFTGSGGSRSYLNNVVITTGVPLSLTGDASLSIERADINAVGGITLAGLAQGNGSGVYTFESIINSNGAGDLFRIDGGPGARAATGDSVDGVSLRDSYVHAPLGRLEIKGRGGPDQGHGVRLSAVSLKGRDLSIEGHAEHSPGVGFEARGAWVTLEATNLSILGESATGTVGVTLGAQSQIMLSGHGTTNIRGNGIDLGDTTISGDAASVTLASTESLGMFFSTLDFREGSGTAITLTANPGAALNGRVDMTFAQVYSGGGDIVFGTSHQVCSARLGCASGGTWIDGQLNVTYSTIDAGGGSIRGGAASLLDGDGLFTSDSTWTARDIALSGRSDASYGIQTGAGTSMTATHRLLLDGVGAGEIDRGQGGVLINEGSRLAVVSAAAESDALLAITGVSRGAVVGQGVHIVGTAGDEATRTLLSVQGAGLSISGTGPGYGVLVRSSDGVAGGSTIDASAARAGAVLEILGTTSTGGISVGISDAVVSGAAMPSNGAALRIVGSSSAAGGAGRAYLAGSTLSAATPVEFSNSGDLGIFTSTVLVQQGGIRVSGRTAADTTGVSIEQSTLRSEGAGDVIRIEGLASTMPGSRGEGLWIGDASSVTAPAGNLVLVGQGGAAGGSGIHLAGATLAAPSVEASGTAQRDGDGILAQAMNGTATRIEAVTLKLDGHGADTAGADPTHIGISLSEGTTLAFTGRGSAQFTGDTIALDNVQASGAPAGFLMQSQGSMLVRGSSLDFSSGAGTAITLTADADASGAGRLRLDGSIVRTGGGAVSGSGAGVQTVDAQGQILPFNSTTLREGSSGVMLQQFTLDAGSGAVTLDGRGPADLAGGWGLLVSGANSLRGGAMSLTGRAGAGGAGISVDEGTTLDLSARTLSVRGETTGLNPDGTVPAGLFVNGAGRWTASESLAIGSGSAGTVELNGVTLVAGGALSIDAADRIALGGSSVSAASIAMNSGLARHGAGLSLVDSTLDAVGGIELNGRSSDGAGVFIDPSRVTAGGMLAIEGTGSSVGIELGEGTQLSGAQVTLNGSGGATGISAASVGSAGITAAQDLTLIGNGGNGGSARGIALAGAWALKAGGALALDAGAGLGLSSAADGASSTPTFDAGSALQLKLGGHGDITIGGAADTVDAAALSRALAGGSTGLSLQVPAGSSVTVAAPLSVPGRLTLAADTIALAPGGALASAAGGDAIALRGAGSSYVGRFDNAAGATALSTPNGRWVGSFASPATVTLGGLLADFTLYDAASLQIPTDAQGNLQTTSGGNGLLFAAPAPYTATYGDSVLVSIEAALAQVVVPLTMSSPTEGRVLDALPNFAFDGEDELSFRAINLTQMSRAELMNLLAARDNYKKKLFADTIFRLEEDPGLADVRPCASEAELKVGDCLITEPLKRQILAAREAAVAKARAKKRPVRQAALPVIERKTALLIGINKYADSRIPELDSAVPDARAVRELLETRLGYEAVVLEDAGKESIVRAFNELALQTGPADSVMIYYAGHGELLPKAGMGYWLPADSRVDQPASWLSNGDIARLVGQLGARQVLLVSDSCYSGTLAGQERVQVDRALGAGELLSRKAAVVMSSGGNEPVSDEGKDGHSVFAWHLLHTLGEVSGWQPGGQVFERVRYAVKREFPQTPQYGSSRAAGHEGNTDYLFELRELDDTPAKEQ